MKTASIPYRRHRAFGGSPGGGNGESGAGRLRRVVFLLALALAWRRPSSLLAEACIDGVEGILSDDGSICCLAACGQCGGSGCSDIAGTEETDCCTADISSGGQICGVNGVVAPCNIDPTLTATEAPAPAVATGQPSAQPVAGGAVQPPTGQPAVAGTPGPVADAATEAPMPAPTTEPTAAPVTPPTTAPVVTTGAPITGVSSTCDNGYPGWQTQEACCSEFCGQCGGSGCGTLGSADCCVDNVMSAELVCGVDVMEAPCIVPVLQDGETYAPVGAPSPTPSPVPPVQTAPTRSPQDSPTSEPSEGRGVDDGETVTTPSPALTGGDGGADATNTPAVPTAAPLGTMPSPGSTDPPVQECTEGIEGIAHDAVCCPVACGQCGGSGCENIEGTGGASDCCSDIILISGQTCIDTGGVSPCVLGAADAVSGATESEDASAARSSMRMDGIVAERKSVVWAFVALGMACFAVFT